MSREQSDFGTPETQAQGGGIDLGHNTDGQRVGKLRGAIHFDVLLARGVVTDKQHLAGEYLRRDAYASGKFAYIKSSADFSVKGNITEQSADFMIDAGRRFAEAIDSLVGWEKLAVNNVVIDDSYLKSISSSPTKQRRAVGYLRSGLDRLIKFYGI